MISTSSNTSHIFFVPYVPLVLHNSISMQIVKIVTVCSSRKRRNVFFDMCHDSCSRTFVSVFFMWNGIHIVMKMEFLTTSRTIQVAIDWYTKRGSCPRKLQPRLQLEVVVSCGLSNS